MKRCLAFAVLLGVVVVLAATSASAGGKKTHVGGNSSQILNLVTSVVPNDNSGGHTFQSDYSGPTFSVPEKYSFVVTDISVLPQGSFAPTENYLVVINIDNGGSRLFIAQFTGGGGFYQSLTTGLVMPAGTTPTARNTISSSNSVSVQLRGYYVKGEGHPSNTSPF
jgi:hypothetical protein